MNEGGEGEAPPPSLLEGSAVVGGAASPPLPVLQGHAGKASVTPPEASGESGEQRPTSPISWCGNAGGAGCTGGRASGKKQQKLLAGE